jgi:hypothetical protein
MVPDDYKIKMAKAADDSYRRKYAKLTRVYLEKPGTHGNLEDVISGKVSISHGDAVTNYSGGVSGAVNEAIRGQYLDLTVDVQAYELLLNTALKNLPPFSDQIVYRMVLHVENTDPYEAYFKRNITKVLNEPCYLSASKEDWDWEKVVYIIKTLKENSHARDISRITNKADEKEVLFCKNTNFLIKTVIKKNERLFVDMEETKNDADTVLNYYDNPDAPLSENEEPGLFD